MANPVFSILTHVVAHFTHLWHNYTTKPPKPRETVKFGQFVLLMPYLTDECRQTDLEILNNSEKPNTLFGKPTMDDLNLISFGQYSDLCDAMGEQNHIAAIGKMVTTLYPNKSQWDIDREDVIKVFGFANFVCKEVDRINKLFSSVHLEYTDQELRAGIEDMQFGVFGILDWYSKRMGITDQNDVMSIGWVRIYTCMKNDTQEADFNRRLQKVYESDAKHK